MGWVTLGEDCYVRLVSGCAGLSLTEIISDEVYWSRLHCVRIGRGDGLGQSWSRLVEIRSGRRWSGLGVLAASGDVYPRSILVTRNRGSLVVWIPSLQRWRGGGKGGA